MFRTTFIFFSFHIQHYQCTYVALCIWRNLLFRYATDKILRLESKGFVHFWGKHALMAGNA